MKIEVPKPSPPQRTLNNKTHVLKCHYDKERVVRVLRSVIFIFTDGWLFAIMYIHLSVMSQSKFLAHRVQRPLNCISFTCDMDELFLVDRNINTFFK